jgi:hypothetical protein
MSTRPSKGSGRVITRKQVNRWSRGGIWETGGQVIKGLRFIGEPPPPPCSRLFPACYEPLAPRLLFPARRFVCVLAPLTALRLALMRYRLPSTGPPARYCHFDQAACGDRSLFDFTGRRGADPVMGSSDVCLIIGKPSRQGITKPSEIGVAADVHQNVQMFAAFGFTNEDSVEGFVGRVTA